MASRPQKLPPMRRIAASFCLILVMLLAVAGPTAAAEPAAPSLALVPQDADFYTSCMRIGEQIEIVKNSNWWNQLNQWQPILQAKFFINFGLQGSPQGQQFQQWKAQPENQQLLDLAADMFSTEVFCYGSPGVSESIGLLGEVYGAAIMGAFQYQSVGKFSGESQDDFMARTILQFVNEQRDRLKIPTFVMGFKLSDTEPAVQQLSRLEGLVKVVLDSEPDLAVIADRFKRTTIGGSEFLTLDIDGSLVPWDEVPFDRIEQEPGQFDELVAVLKKMTLSISLGVHKGYLMLSIGESNDHLAKLGTGEVLADHPRLAPLAKQGAQRFTDVAYISDNFVNTFQTKPEDIDQMVVAAGAYLPMLGLPPDLQKQLMDDVEEFGEDLKGSITQLGAQLFFSYLTERGYENFHYDWSENVTLDGSQPLTLVDHLGGTPICACLARAQQHPESYDALVKWLKKARGYFEQFAVPRMGERDREQYELFSGIAYPILERLDDVNRTSLIPALADGQAGLVFDGGEKSTRWHAALPPTHEEVAVPSPAIILGLKDEALFRQALGEYREILNESLEKLHELQPNAPDFQLPEAQVFNLPEADVYFYRLPKEFGVHEGVAPNVAINDKMAVFSLIPRHTQRIVRSTPLDVDGGPVANIGSRPVAAVNYFSFAALIDAVVPWADEGVRYYVQSMQEALGGLDPNDANGGDSPAAKQILDQIQQGAKFLKAFRGYSSVTYVEEGATITHGEARFKDLE